MDASTASVVVAYVALGGAAFGLLEFGIGALLWADQKLIVAVGLAATVIGLYLGMLTIHLALTL